MEQQKDKWALFLVRRSLNAPSFNHLHIALVVVISLHHGFLNRITLNQTITTNKWLKTNPHPHANVLLVLNNKWPNFSFFFNNSSSCSYNRPKTNFNNSSHNFHNINNLPNIRKRQPQINLHKSNQSIRHHQVFARQVVSVRTNHQVFGPQHRTPKCLLSPIHLDVRQASRGSKKRWCSWRRESLRRKMSLGQSLTKLNWIHKSNSKRLKINSNIKKTL